MLVTTRRRRTLVARSLVVFLLALTLSSCEGFWGIRTSYRNYIAGSIAHGEILASDGARHLDGEGAGKGPFMWRLASATFDPATTQGTVNLRGTVVTRGHQNSNGIWILDATFRNPTLVINGDTGTLYADLTFRPFAGFNPNPVPPLQTVDGAAFATVDLSGVDWTPNSDGKRTIRDAPMVGVNSTMELIGWDDFYGLPVTLDPLSVTF